MQKQIGKLLVGTSPLSLVPYILAEIRGHKVLDVGCGAGIYGYLLRNKWQDCYPGRNQFRDFGNRDVTNDEPQLLVGCDVTLENIRRVSKHNIYDYACLADAANLPFGDGLVDTIICVEVLEHLEKRQALDAIEKFKKIASQRIIITVPKNAVNPISKSDDRGFLNIEIANEDIREYVHAERHKSSFTQKELIGLGFQLGETIDSKGIKGYLKRIRRWYRNTFGIFSGQFLAILDVGKTPSSLEPALPMSSKETEGYPDFR
jgi:SAM-dependent methyltransferase